MDNVGLKNWILKSTGIKKLMPKAPAFSDQFFILMLFWQQEQQFLE